METGETKECEECGATVATDELMSWSPPGGAPLWVCSACATNLEMEL